MALLDIVKKGSTSRSVELFIFDNTTGLPKTGLTYASTGIDLWYRRERSAIVSITEVTIAALTTGFTTSAGGAGGSFIEVANGWYSLDIPDAALATGANWVLIGGTLTGYTVVGGTIRLVDIDLEDTVRAGLTALPNAAAAAAGGLPVSTAGSLAMDKIGYLPAITAGNAGGVFIAGTNAATTITTALTTTFTGNLTGNVGGTVATVNAIATDAISAAATSAAAINKIADGIATRDLVEAYSAKGGLLTLAKALYEIVQQLQEASTSGTTTETIKKRDASTTAFTETLNSATAPTSITRAT